MSARIVLAAALGLTALAGCARPFAPYAATPAAIAPPAGQVHRVSLAARGVQVYECRAGAAGAAPAWALVAPDAELFDAAGRRVGSHGAGPHWQAEDGSRVVARLKARSPAPDASAIPWLLLDVQPDGQPAGTAGGLFSGIASIQRINTTGGLPPAEPCTQERIGTPARSPYTADYRFYAAAR